MHHAPRDDGLRKGIGGLLDQRLLLRHHFYHGAALG
jgi:hypothetical protein